MLSVMLLMLFVVSPGFLFVALASSLKAGKFSVGKGINYVIAISPGLLSLMLLLIDDKSLSNMVEPFGVGIVSWTTAVVRVISEGRRMNPMALVVLLHVLAILVWVFTPILPE